MEGGEGREFSVMTALIGAHWRLHDRYICIMTDSLILQYVCTVAEIDDTTGY